MAGCNRKRKKGREKKMEDLEIEMEKEKPRRWEENLKCAIKSRGKCISRSK